MLWSQTAGLFVVPRRQVLHLLDPLSVEPAHSKLLAASHEWFLFACLLAYCLFANTPLVLSLSHHPNQLWQMAALTEPGSTRGLLLVKWEFFLSIIVSF